MGNQLKEYLLKESKSGYTEFRLVVRDDNTCYIHVMDRDSETFDFLLDSKEEHLKGLVKEYPNDADLGEAIRKIVYQ